jgi:hypothetical protein
MTWVISLEDLILSVQRRDWDIAQLLCKYLLHDLVLLCNVVSVYLNR